MSDAENQENRSSHNPVSQDDSKPNSSEAPEKNMSPAKLPTPSSTDKSLEPVKTTSEPSNANQRDDQHDAERPEAEHGSYTVYDPTGHYANGKHILLLSRPLNRGLFISLSLYIPLLLQN
jgi:hypothetical protein